MGLSFIGAGSIGTEAFIQVKEKGWQVGSIVTKSGVYEHRGFDPSKGEILSDYLKRNPLLKIDKKENYLDYIEGSDAVLLMIPTIDDGSAAYKMIKDITDREVPVVTSEKGALSYRFGDLEELIDNQYLRFNASVGGGLHIPERIQERALTGNVEEIYCINNASLNFIIEESAKGSLNDAVEMAKKKKIVEPGSNSLLAIINAEANGDVPRKTAIEFNVFMHTIGQPENYISYSDFKTETIDERMLKEIVKKANSKKFIVSIEKNGEEGLNNSIGGFEFFKGDWLIKGGFRDKNENTIFEKIWVDGHNNAIVFKEGKYGSRGIYFEGGDGAMPGPTVKTMIYDVLKLMKIEQ